MGKKKRASKMPRWNGAPAVPLSNEELKARLSEEDDVQVNMDFGDHGYSGHMSQLDNLKLLDAWLGGRLLKGKEL